MLKRILVPVRGDGMGDIVLSHASVLAHRHNAHIVVAHCRPNPSEMVPYHAGLFKFARETMLQQAAELSNQEEAELRERLHERARALDLSETREPKGDRPSVEFIEETGRMMDIVRHQGRLADLIAVAKPDRDRNLGTNTLKAGLFQTGRPVLMCPAQSAPPAEIGAHVAVAWNGSLEAARMVALTLGLVEAAQTVTILYGGKPLTYGTTVDELVGYYALRGVSASVRRFEAQNPGAALLSEASSAGADLLLMGAYSVSHERETLLGGNTQAVVDKAEMAVVMAH
ncbi:universal stress protein [Thalassococcus sp. S3]|uniref:universal stress protein n=1 Tax=Thalassococcus sp. S3 TaxID=2017482 RepID=UPI001024777B|nr:universal stress protein [Thalassococcus sp. S3]QBF33451.1 universal stress protein UspA [Thalassococcus sp. S3]